MVEDTCFQCEIWWMDDRLTRNEDMMRWGGVGVAGWLDKVFVGQMKFFA